MAGITADNFTVADTTGNTDIGGTLDVGSTATVDGLLTANAGISADNFTVADTSGNTSVGGTVTVDGLLTANGGITADNFTVANTTGNTDIGGTLDVGSTATVDGLLTANGGITADNFTVADTSGNTQIGGTLTVTSTVTATAEGSQIADFTFNNGELTSATGTIDFVNENLTTTGAAAVASLSVSEGNITNVGDISLDTISSDGSTVQVLMDDNVAGSFEIKEGLNSYIKVDTTDGSELVTFSKNVTFAGTTTFTSGAIGLNGGNIVVNDDGNATDFRVETPLSTEALLVDGTNDLVEVNRPFNVTGATTITGGVDITGATSVDGVLSVLSADLAGDANNQSAIVLLNSDATAVGTERDAKIEGQRAQLPTHTFNGMSQKMSGQFQTPYTLLVTLMLTATSPLPHQTGILLLAGLLELPLRSQQPQRDLRLQTSPLTTAS